MSGLSIILPVYNVPIDYFHACLRSLLNQTMKDLQVILVNDGSTNGCENVCDEYAALDNRIQVIHQKNNGVSVSRNQGIKVANREWIMFVDPDDWLELDACEILIENIKENPDLDILIWGHKENYSNSEVSQSANKHKLKAIKKFTPKEKEFLLLNLIDESKSLNVEWPEYDVFGAVWAKCFRRELLVNNEIYFDEDLSKVEDTIFNLNAISKAEGIAFLNKEFYHYRINSDSVCQRYFPNLDFTHAKVLKKMDQFVKQNQGFPSLKNAMAMRVVLLYIKELEQNYFHEDNVDKYFKNRKKWLVTVNKKVINQALHTILNEQDFRISRKMKLIVLLSLKKQFLLLSSIWKLKELLSKNQIQS